MGDPSRDLVLVYRPRKRKLILPNIQGQRYTFGSKYPGARDGEEFVFSRDERFLVNPTHCAITVDDKGQYYIQNDTTYADGRASRTSVYTTFLNSERVNGVEKRLLKVGDVISIGFPESGAPWGEWGQRPIYRVQERKILSGSSGSGPQIEDFGNDEEMQTVESPFDNNLIVSKIMEYLPVSALKNARQMSKKWDEEATKVLEKKAVVFFEFGVDYVDSTCSTMVFRFLHEMRGLKMRNLHIRLKLSPQLQFQYRIAKSNSYEQFPLLFSQGEPGDKMLDDIRKLLNSSHNFSSLLLEYDTTTEAAFVPFFLILQEAGENLEELELRGKLPFSPELLRPLPTMKNLKKFKHDVCFRVGQRRRWVSYIVPLFAKSLERFTSSGRSLAVVEFYLQEFLKQEMPKLKGISIEGPLPSQGLSLLLELKNPLTSLDIYYCKDPAEPGVTCPLLEELLLKNSKSFQNLAIRISHEYEMIDIQFPPFPNLVELELTCEGRTRINWGGQSLDYTEQFPSLRKLKVSPAWWLNEDGVTRFSPFFPEEGEVRCEKVTDLCVKNALPRNATPAQKETFQRRMDKIKEMFPNVDEIKFF